MRKILLTGGAGFIGAYCLEMLLQKYPDYYVVNIDKLTYASDLSRLKKHIKNPNYHFVLGDITDVLLVAHLFNQFQFDAVIHIAAESHVDRSIIDPPLFVKTNIEGTNVLLHAAYTHWFEGPKQVRSNFLHHRFLYISTDEVYGSLSDPIDAFREDAPMAPTNPYSGSKAAAECLVNAYLHSYGLDMVVTRSTNNYGIGQHSEKLIPMVVDRALKGQSIPLHGDGGMIREWLHVTDHVRAIDLVFHQGKSGHTYNIGSYDRRTNLAVAHMICKLLDRMKPLAEKSYTALITFVADRPSQDRRYALDNRKISEQLGWKPMISFQEGLEELVANYYEQCALRF
ncbi:MAG: dTDP-glucose 4,6-dehydratase [Amoebophilaceae bacterium]|nr:dTDP-glucose 4,6-dehydratase [Amoebophilaceae bacterium]